MTMIIDGSTGLEFPDGSDQTSAFTGNAASITSGTIATARLATGTANSSTYLRGDQTWASIPSGTRISGGTTGLTPATLTSGDVTLAGTLAVANGGTGANTAATARTNLGVVIGTDVLAPTGTGTGLTALNASNVTSGTIATARLASGTANSGTYLRGDQTWSALPSSGKLLQVQQTVISSAVSQSTSYPSWQDLSGFSVNITPSSASSRILVQVHFGCVTSSTNYIGFRFLRSGTVIGVADASGSRPQASFRCMREGDTNHNKANPSMIFLDSPATTSARTYSLQWQPEGSGNIFVNRTQTDADGQSYGARTISTITVWEIAA